MVLMIGLALVKVGVQYAAGGVPLMGKPEFGSLADVDSGTGGYCCHASDQVLHARASRPSRRCLSASSPATSWR
jgi:hypothetical protein